MIVDYIDDHKHRFGVAPLCRVLGEHGLQIAPSTYYAAKQRGISDTTWADAHAANVVFDLWRTNRGLYGVRKLWHAARRAGHNLGRDQVARLMRLIGIDGIVRGRGAPRKPPNHARCPRCGTRIWSGGPGRRRTGRISGGLPISPTAGLCPGSVTPRSAWMCFRGGFWVGG